MDKQLLLKLGATEAQIRDKYMCQYCGHDGLASPENWRCSQVDHFIPESKGGSDELENKVTACNYCNALKKDKVFDSIEDVIEDIKKRKEEDNDHIKQLKQAFK